MSREMLINTVAGQESRIAVVQNGKLEELYVERTSSASHVGNIYKGKIVNIESAIQAVFVDFGLNKHGFLHISDVHPQYFPKDRRKASEDVGRKRPRHTRPPIQDCFQRGQEVVVQMTKEGIGTKGPTLTTYVSIPGRMLVMMPGMSRLGISRKIEDEQVRSQTRQTLAKLKLEPDVGFIVRTAGVGKSQRELQRDLNYLTRLWKSVKKRIDSTPAPCEIYQESDLVIRTIRDVYKSDIKRVLCDDESVARKIREFFRVATPRTKYRIELYTGDQGLFHDFGVEQEIEKISMHKVELSQGGSIIFDQTEALVAIDVNSGRFRDHDNAETTALKTNQAAATEIARQLRLRDMGGVIVIDFIDMRESKNRRAVEKTLRDAMKTDRAKTKLLKINAFGIFELTRQRMRPSLKDSIYGECPHCEGTGRIKSQESLSLQVMRNLQRAAANKDVANIEISVNPMAAHHLANSQRRQISQLEAAAGKTITIQSDAELSGDEIVIKCSNARGSKVAWDHPALIREGSAEAKSIALEEIDAQKNTEKAKQQPHQTGASKDEEPAPAAKKARRRGRRGGRKHQKKDPAANGETPQAEQPKAEQPKAEQPKAEQPKAEQPKAEDKPAEKKKTRRKRSTRTKAPKAKQETTIENKQPTSVERFEAHEAPKPSSPADADQKPRKPRRKRSRRNKADRNEAKPEESKAVNAPPQKTGKVEPHEIMAPTPAKTEKDSEDKPRKKTRRKRSRKKTEKKE